MFADGDASKSKLSVKAFSRDNIQKVKDSDCNKSCRRNCLDAITAEDIYQMRLRYWTKPTVLKNQFLLQRLGLSKNGFLMCDNGHKVCRSAFEKILRLNKNKLTVLQKKKETNGVVSTSGRAHKKHSEKIVEAISWIQQFSSVHGDRMPDSNKIMLPYKTEKFSIYSSYKQEKEKGVSKTSFYRIWKTHFPHLKIKQVNLLFFFFI